LSRVFRRQELTLWSQAAVILSASVAFVAIPGVDTAARTAALIAILCSAASILGTLLAVLRYKLDLGRAPSFLSGESPLILSVRSSSLFLFAKTNRFALQRRSIVLALPLALLSWAVSAFIIGGILYLSHVLPPMHGTSYYTLLCAVAGVTGILVIGGLCVHE
jgi:hypothetical protein